MAKFRGQQNTVLSKQQQQYLLQSLMSFAAGCGCAVLEMTATIVRYYFNVQTNRAIYRRLFRLPPQTSRRAMVHDVVSPRFSPPSRRVLRRGIILVLRWRETRALLVRNIALKFSIRLARSLRHCVYHNIWWIRCTARPAGSTSNRNDD